MPEWAKHGHETRPWRQIARAGSRADRTVSEVVVSLPPLLAGTSWEASPASRPALDAAARSVIALDAEHGSRLGALGRLLIQAEAVSSSRIEQVDATLEEYARATIGIRSNPSATSMVAATEAIGATSIRSCRPRSRTRSSSPSTPSPTVTAGSAAR